MQVEVQVQAGNKVWREAPRMHSSVPAPARGLDQRILFPQQG
jgi:hypothetical protein